MFLAIERPKNIFLNFTDSFSSYKKMLRVMSYVLKFLDGARKCKISKNNPTNLCNKIIRRCVHCFRYKPKLMTQIMGTVPADRVRALRPFLIVGGDFCGPVNITYRIRGDRLSKCTFRFTYVSHLRRYI